MRLFDIVNFSVAQWLAAKSVPRTRGDEPAWHLVLAAELERSPHTRG